MLIRFIVFCLGLFVCAIGSNFIVASNLGADPWNVFHLGVSLNTSLTFGQANQLVAAMILTLGWVLKVRPGVGTFLNMFLLGYFIDIVGSLGVINPPKSLILRCLFILIGTILKGTGIGVYINGRLGAGPRDGLTLGLSKSTGKSVSFIRTFLELGALFVGWLLGGPVGMGTIVYSLIIGRVMQWSIKRFRLPEYYYTGKIKDVDG